MYDRYWRSISDFSSLAASSSRASDMRLRVLEACRLDLADGMSVLVYPTDRPAYSRLCRLLSVGKKRGGRRYASCIGRPGRLVGRSDRRVCSGRCDACGLALRRLAKTFGDRAYMALTLRRRPNDQCAATNSTTWRSVFAWQPSRRILQDVVTCIRHNVTIDEAGSSLGPRSARYRASTIPRTPVPDRRPS